MVHISLNTFATMSWVWSFTGTLLLVIYWCFVPTILSD
jgi:hypothetical protein